MTDSIRRVLVAPLNYSHVQHGQYDAFEKVFGKENVIPFDFMEANRAGRNASQELVEIALNRQPDWIWLQVQGSDVIQPWAIRQIREALPSCLITHWMGDCRLEVPEYLAEMCRATHATLISSVGQIPMYQATGARRVEYVQIGLDPEDWDLTIEGNIAMPDFRVPDVVFIGGYYGHVAAFERGTAERIGAIRALRDAGIDVGVVGTGWPDDIRVVGTCHVKHQIPIYRSAKVALSINHFNDIELYYSDRQLISMASGTPVVARYVPGIEQEFAQFAHCLFWKTEAEMIDHVNTLLAGFNPDLGHRGRQHVIKNHTWEKRIWDLAPKAEKWRREIIAP